MSHAVHAMATSVVLPLLALLMSATLAGCAAVGPDYAAPDPAAPAGWRSWLDDGLTPDAVNAGAIAQWWDQLGDIALTQLIRQVIAANPDVRSARAALREARARRAIAGADFFPTISASVSRTHRNRATVGTAGNDLYEAGFDASWEPDVFGGTRRGAEAAQADLEASAASLDATQVSLVAEAALNYVEARALQIRLRIARNNLASQQETWQLADWRVQAGLANSVEVEQARANLEQTRASIPALERSLAEAQNRLAVLAGVAPGTLNERLSQPGAIPAVPQQLAVGIPADALRRRPDVRVAERRVAAETARIGQAQAARYPGVSLSGSIGVESLAFDTLTNGSVARTFVASVAAALFDGGKRRQQVAAQEAVREQALIAYEKTVLAALEDVENGLTAFARSKERQAALRAAAEAARNAALLARQRYTSGLIDFQTVLDTERSVLTIEDTLAAAEAEGASSVITLYKALGGGWTPATPSGQ